MVDCRCASTNESSVFENECVKSKRDGYFELFGSIDIVSSKSHQLTLETSSEIPEGIIKIEIVSDTTRLIDTWVDEYHDCNISFGGNTSNERHYSRLQSERTIDLITSLKERDECELPSYEQSCLQHLLIMEKFREKFLELGIDATGEVPIT